MEELLTFFRKYLPGFESSYLAAIADVTGVRESRRIHGRYTLTVEDVYEERTSSEGVAVCAFPIDIHDPTGADLQWVRRKQDFCYDIPYGVMVPQKIGNLLVRDGVSRLPTKPGLRTHLRHGLALGQAAGTAACLPSTRRSPLTIWM